VTDLVVHNAEHSVFGDEEVFILSVTVTYDDGSTREMAELMPADIFESRAAEYDIDPTTEQGWSDVLHMVLYENHLGQDAEEQLADPDHLLNAPTIGHARRKHLERVHRVRGKGRLRGQVGPPESRNILNNARMLATSGDAEDPLEFIRRKAAISKPHMRVKKEFTRRRRNAVRARRQGRARIEMADADSATRQAARDMRMRPQRMSPEKLGEWLWGAPVTDPRNPPRNPPK
jgi:hypothetical protein